MLELIKLVNLGIRFILELCALYALGYWGFSYGKGTLLKLALGIGSPLVLAVVWGAFGSPNAPVKLSFSMHLLLEIAVFGLPALALYAAGRSGWAAVYATAVVVNGILMYVWNQ